MTRAFDAHLSPSIMFQGLALAELTSAGMFMLKARPDARRSPLFLVSMAAWVVVAAATVMSIAIIDWSASPFVTETGWHARRVIAAFVLNAVAVAMVLVLFMMRIRIFHQNKSPTFWLLLLLAITTMGFTVPATVIGVQANMEVLDGKIAIFYQSSRLETANALFSASYSLNGLFSALSSMAFLWEIGSSLGFSTQGFVTEILFNHDGVRFVVIFALNAVIAGFAVHAYINKFTYVTYTAFYMPTLIYATEIHTFLLTSYVAPREIIEKARAGAAAPTGMASAWPESLELHSSEERRTRLEMEQDRMRSRTLRS
ncbi:hypothetical protein HK105_207941 [Polyrhizophydium stewartii]|uniref:Uncharacterized protein n=1 Tax=Polyrhizophydium stewartii TaxID=2732419 RepID=A0ABR4MZ83_9FUNG|nr:hypothetical protein HK105_002242 [Polyrhizophydium stewartii]